MQKFKKRKGFTLTELAIVIAVIAILIAVLVPTFVSLINKANESSDKQLVKNLNTSLSTHTSVVTPADALDAVEEDGYSVEKLKTESDSEIIYDAATTSFVLLTDGEVSYPSGHSIDLNASTTWYFVSSQSEITSTTASYIVTGNWSASSASAQTVQAAKTSIKKATEVTTSTEITYEGLGGVDTSRASGIDTVNYNFKVDSTYEANIVINVTNSKSVTIDLTDVKNSNTKIVINNYSSEEVSIAITSSESITTAEIEVNNKGESICYADKNISESITYSGNTDNYVEVNASFTEELQLGTENYPYKATSDSISDVIDMLTSTTTTYYINLEEDISGAVTIPENITAIINLNGYELSNTSNVLTVSSGANVTVNGTGKITSAAGSAISNSGSLVVNNAELSGYRGIFNNANSVATVNGGTITGNNLTTSGTTYAGIGIYVYTDASVIVDNATITGYYSVYNYAGEVTVDSVSVSSTYRAIYNCSYGTMYIYDSTISGNTHGILNSGTLYVDGGYIYSANRSIENTGTAYIYGGTIGQITIGETTYTSSYGVMAFNSATTNISGGTIISNNVTIYNDATVNLSGSAVIKCEADCSGWAYGISMRAGAITTIKDNVEVKATNANDVGYSAGIVYIGDGDETNATFISMSGGTIYGGTYGISGNGSASYSTVSISGGSIEGGVVGYYHPEMGTLKITGGSITGYLAGLQICAGTITISGGTLTATATAEEISKDANNVANKTGDGIIADGAALSIINRSGYGLTQSSGSCSFGEGSITISGGEFVSACENSILAYSYNSSTGASTWAYTNYISITGGTYTIGTITVDTEEETEEGTATE